MVILIGGASHTGKTQAAQRLLERYKMPHISLDHIKMGLIRGWTDCGFTACDNDDVIAEKLWGITEGIIRTNLENGQNIIIEGCYLPPEMVAKLVGCEIIAVYIVLSEAYLRQSFDRLIEFESVIEKRNYKETRSVEQFIEENRTVKQKCEFVGLYYIEIEKDYEEEIQHLFNYVDKHIMPEESKTRSS